MIWSIPLDSAYIRRWLFTSSHRASLISSTSNIPVITLANMNFNVVWLDSNSSDHQSTFLRKLDNQAQAFTDVALCVHYIQSHPHQPIFFIVSGSLAKEAVPQVYDLAQVKQILLFCGSVAAYCHWALDYVDKIVIFDHGDDLLERLWNELDSCLQEQAKVCLKQAREFKERALRYQQKCGWASERDRATLLLYWSLSDIVKNKRSSVWNKRRLFILIAIA